MSSDDDPRADALVRAVGGGGARAHPRRRRKEKGDATRGLQGLAEFPNTSATNSDVTLVNAKTGMTSPTSAAQQWPVIEFLELFRERLGGLLRP